MNLDSVPNKQETDSMFSVKKQMDRQSIINAGTTFVEPKKNGTGGFLISLNKKIVSANKLPTTRFINLT